MTQNTSSAVYTELFRYSDVTLQLDASLTSEAHRLRGALEHFEATCREPGYRLQVAHVADGITAHTLAAAAVDGWVRVVGHGFQVADSGGWAALLPPWLPPWLLWPVRLLWPIGGGGPVDPGYIIGPRLPWQPPQFTWPPFGWKPPDWIRFPWWPGDNRIIPFPKQPGPIRIILDPPGNGDGNNGQTELGKLLPGEPAPGDANNGETELGKILRPPEKEALRQDQVEGNDPLLGAIRYERDAKGNLITEGAWFGPINTVRDHIKAYGCLMTSFTMLLRDQGQNITVTDLYRSNYKKQTGRSIDEDLARNDDQDADGKQDVILQNLQLDSSAVKDVARDKYQAADGENLPTGDPVQALCRNLTAHGSVIIQVKTGSADGHWVVVDSYDAATNTFTLRDPMKGSVTGVKIPGSEYKPKGPVKYLQPL